MSCNLFSADQGPLILMTPRLLDLSVSLAFGGFTLDVALETPLSGISALFGPSGGGKSTLLRIIAGLEARAEGHVRYDGQVWQGAGRFTPAHKRGVGTVFQDARLFPHLTVLGNLRYAEKRSRVRGHPVTLEAVTDALDLGPLLARRTEALSGGERQRVALGRTLLTRPSLLLLDEPLAALDRGRKADILPYLRDMPARFGIPALYVSHAIEEVAQIAERVIILADGRIRAEGPTVDILERVDLQGITGRFEAGALLTTRVTAQDEGYQLTRLDLEGQSLTMPMLRALAPGDTARVRIRARDVALAVRRPEGLSTRNILSGQIDTLTPEPDTAFTEAVITIGSQKLRARITREAADSLALTLGMPVHALIKSASFDRRGLGRG